MYLVRKVTRAKWRPKAGVLPGEIPADAVTADLRTVDNTLSFWTGAVGDDEDLDLVALALAATGERPNTIDLVSLSGEEVRDDGLEWVAAPGKTVVEPMIDRHVDLHSLDYERLGHIARQMLTVIDAAQVRRFTRADVAKLVARGVRQGMVDLDQLEDGLRAAVEPRLRE